MQLLVLIGPVGASPHIGEILPPCDFFLTVLSCPVLGVNRQFQFSKGKIKKLQYLQSYESDQDQI